MGSSEEFDRFRRVVLDDPELQVRLRAITDWPAFVDAAVAAADERGIVITKDIVLAARSESRRAWLERWV